jgi:hypothetical protein
MGLSRVTELVSQAEKEGVSLGLLISREMSLEEMDAAQLDLAAALSENYCSINHFMAEVKVPSIDEILSKSETNLVSAGRLPSDEMAAMG